VATATATSFLTALLPEAADATLTAAAAMVEAPTMEPTGGPAAAAVAAAVAMQTATPLAPHRAATMLARRLRSCGRRSRPPQATTTASPPSHLDFATCSSPTSSSFWGSPSIDAKQDLIQWLRCYTLSIENTGGNNDTKCLYFPFCLDQAPLTWLESLDKQSIDKWD
jgi:hypothetical protein